MGNESGTARRKMTSSRFVTPLGFSNGWAEFAPKNPPPFWPNILIDSQEATGPIGTLWDAPSNDPVVRRPKRDRKSTRLNSSHEWISYAVFCLKKKRRRRYA